MSLYSGFTRLCKGLAVVLIGGHIVVQILPISVSYLALIPAKATDIHKHTICCRNGNPKPLFKELKDEEVEVYRLKFAGSQADRIVKAETEARAKNLAGKLKETKFSEPEGMRPL